MRIRTLASRSAGALVAVLFLGACSGSTPATTGDAGSRVTGGTATIAQTGLGPNYILPLTPAQYFYGPSRTNLQALLFRPLYWFGTAGKAAVDFDRSLAYPPVFSPDGKSVTITLRDYSWSDGTAVSARDISFWQNLVSANKAAWGAYTPGNYPDNVTRTTIVNPKTIRFHLTKAYDQQWFLYNQLSQITPMPQHAWGRTSTGGAITDADRTPAGARKIYAFLDGQAKHLETYASNPLWKIVDGPWTLSDYTPADGSLAFVPNLKYSGPHRATLDRLVGKTYTSTEAEFAALRSGSGPDVGYISPVQLPAQPALDRQGYALNKSYTFGIQYNLLNYADPKVGPLFRQAYLRRALQLLVDQEGINKAYYSGAGYPTCGPIPSRPDNDFADARSRACPPGYDPAAAVSLLQAHGWTVVKGGTSTCRRPGTGGDECGAGIRAGTPLKFTLTYATGGIAYPKTLIQQKSDAAAAGVVYTLDPQPPGGYGAKVVPCGATKGGCSWQMAGYGWNYSPNYYPSGEGLFATGGGFNVGGYSDPTADRLIAASTTAGDSRRTLDAYQDYILEQNPVIWQTNTDSLNEIRTTLKGVDPLNAFGYFTPEEWYFTR